MDSLKTVASQLAHWRDELINLGKGNRLLYYNATKTSTLAIGEPAPSTVLGRLREPGKEGGTSTSLQGSQSRRRPLFRLLCPHELQTNCSPPRPTLSRLVQPFGT
jgi:hypothetical protein